MKNPNLTENELRGIFKFNSEWTPKDFRISAIIDRRGKGINLYTLRMAKSGYFVIEARMKLERFPNLAKNVQRRKSKISGKTPYCRDGASSTELAREKLIMNWGWTERKTQNEARMKLGWSPRKRLSGTPSLRLSSCLLRMLSGRMERGCYPRAQK